MKDDADRERLRKVVAQSKELNQIAEKDITSAELLPMPEVGKIRYRLQSGEIITGGFKNGDVMWDVDSGAGSDPS